MEVLESSLHQVHEWSLMDPEARKALRKQLRATLQVYKDPSKTPPKLRDQIEGAFTEERAKIAKEKEEVEQARAKLRRAEKAAEPAPIGKRRITIEEE